MNNYLLRVCNWNLHICDRECAACLWPGLLKPYGQQMLKYSLSYSLWKWSLWEVTVISRMQLCSQQERGALFLLWKNSKVDFKTSCCTSITVQESCFGYNMLCKKKKKQQKNRCIFLYALKISSFPRKARSEQLWNKMDRLLIYISAAKMFPLSAWERSRRGLKSLQT